MNDGDGSWKGTTVNGLDPRSAHRDSVPATLVTTQTGRPAWQVNRHGAVKAFSRDPRLSIADPALVQARPAASLSSGEADLREQAVRPADWSKALHRAFSPQRVEDLRPRIAEIVRDLLDAIATGGRPPDLHNEFSSPLVTLASCALLGVSDHDGRRFRAWWEAVKSGTPAESAEAQTALLGYVRDLYVSRQAEPGDDFVSALIAAQGSGARYTDKAIKFLTSLISKGRETPTNALDWAIVLLLRNPQDYQCLVREPRLVGSAVEEALRLFPVISGKVQGPEGIRRFALADFGEGTSLIKRGDLVLLNVVAANMDTAVFQEPERFDIGRNPNPHLTFGFGQHACPAARLARLELRTAINGLLERFPTLRLAVEPARLRYRERPTSGGFEALPVTW